MSFLQPLLLFGLPLIGLPILIHLINQWRHKTLPWGAMMFLLDAKRMTRGMARLRFWLIMATRMLAVAALCFAMARPLTSGWLGLAIGGQAETTLILLDRSSSMEQQNLAMARSKRTAALTQVADVLRSAGHTSRIVLIESTENAIHELDAPDALLSSLDTTGTATTADLPGLLQKALDYTVANETGRTDIWICSDLRENDWNAGDGRWASIRDGFQSLDGVKFYLLSYDEPAHDNVAISVSNVRQRVIGDERELIFDVKLTSEADQPTSAHIPCEVIINGTRSIVDVEMTGNEYLLQGYQVPLDADATGGWGRVGLPADENPLDNTAYFVFADPPVHHTTIVADDERIAETLRIAAIAPLDPAVSYTSEVLSPARSNEVDFGRSSLILWQTEIPEGLLAEQLRAFVEGGRPIVFFPPDAGGANEIFGIGWDNWRRTDEDHVIPVVSWRGDSDLWAHSASGEPLGIGDLRTYSYRKIRSSTGYPLARLDGGDPLLYRTMHTGGAAYFCTTLPLLPSSSLAQDGLAFYALIQRALSSGAATQGKARNLIAGTRAAQRVSNWQPSDDDSRQQLPSSRWLQPGAYEHDSEWISLNRPVSEDVARILSREEADALLSGLDVQHVNQSLATAAPLTSEIWRALLIIMALALITEAFLCMPEPKSGAADTTASRPASVTKRDWRTAGRETTPSATGEAATP
jgi:hypothetical protein